MIKDDSPPSPRAELAKAYEFAQVEENWRRRWAAEHPFRAGLEPDRPAFCIVIPPPNVTGVLHVGHALNNTLQDVLVRYHRMRGDNTLWVPGTDHAGIATQNVVERQLAAEGSSRHAIGRERFVDRVWQWRQESGGQIIHQLKRLGCSCDWERERFTMDEGLSRAVREVFVRLYQDGLIYQGDYIINWCPRCLTALADLEVEHEPTAGQLYVIRYPLAAGSGHLLVATTRPETMLGDTAVAVHPGDERYRHLTGSSVLLPLVGRPIPVVMDTHVDMAFGTGALKVTPAHDLADFELARRHDLPAMKIMDNEGRMTGEAGPYAGLDRFACRQQVVADLAAAGLLERVEDYQHGVGHCYRCRTVVEPTLSRQWFVAVKPLAAKAMAAVRSGETRIHPAAWEKSFFDWMENIRDWCISRQIWWGHQVPAWTCGACGRLVVAVEAPRACPDCGAGQLSQSPDVLDTWFSSALWPFSTLGWPEATRELALFYPTSVLVTSFDILFFWVARMMMMGIHFLGQSPFADVYLHALVRDAQGQKMSKSKGNVLDPLLLMDRYGTDALRLTLTAFAAQGREIRLAEERIEGYRHFLNKLWNASRFALPHLPAAAEPLPPAAELGLAHRWILSRLARTMKATIEALHSYHFDDVANTIYQFFWYEFCDWYLEWIKPALYGEDSPERRASRLVLGRVLEDAIALLHPVVPFITEELWQVLPGKGELLCRSPFPTPEEDRIDPQAEAAMAVVQGVTAGLRTIRADLSIPPGAWISARIVAPDPERAELLAANREAIGLLARAKEVEVVTSGERPAGAAGHLWQDVEIFVPVAGLVDIEQEMAKLARERQKVEQQLAGVTKKLANEQFRAQAPAAVVAAEAEKEEKLLARLATIDANRQRLQELQA
ncbi:MAG: valine--tRNA ligase [Thermodesulfobacteriota bacterium]